jgi:hypothetical protein
VIMERMQVGIEMWFKASRRQLTPRDSVALYNWLTRKVGQAVEDPVTILAVGYRPNDPLSFRSYYGDGTYAYGRTDGQVRIGGGIKGWIAA